MQNNAGNFSMQDAMRIMNSPAGKELMDLLKNSTDPAVRTAMEQAAGGNMEQAQSAVQKLAASAEIRQLLKKAGEQNG